MSLSLWTSMYLLASLFILSLSAWSILRLLNTLIEVPLPQLTMRSLRRWLVSIQIPTRQSLPCSIYSLEALHCQMTS